MKKQILFMMSIIMIVLMAVVSCKKEQEVVIDPAAEAAAQKEFEQNLYSFSAKPEILYREFAESDYWRRIYGLFEVTTIPKGTKLNLGIDGKEYSGILNANSTAIKFNGVWWLKNSRILFWDIILPKISYSFENIPMSQDIPGSRDEDPPLWTVSIEEATPLFLKYPLNGRILYDSFKESEGMIAEISLFAQGIYANDPEITGVQIWGPASRLVWNGQVVAFIKPGGDLW
jgi:hypothetical protein